MIPRSQECLSLAAPVALVQGSCGLFPGIPCPDSLPAPGSGQRRSRDLGSVALEDAPGCCSQCPGMGVQPCSVLSWPGHLMVLPPGWESWGQPSERAGGLLSWLQALGQGPSVPEFPGGEQEGAGPCRDCPEQGGSTQGRAGAGSIHISLLPFPEAPPAAQAAPGVLCPFQPHLGRKGECAGDLCPVSPGVGLELGTAGVEQCPQRAALAARAQGTWLDGRWGLTVSPGSCNAAGRGTWSCLSRERSALGRAHPTPGLARKHQPSLPFTEHSHHHESPGLSQCSSQGWAEPPAAGAAGPWQSWGSAGFQWVLLHVSIVGVPIHGLHPCPCMRVTCCPAAPWL